MAKRNRDDRDLPASIKSLPRPESPAAPQNLAASLKALRLPNSVAAPEGTPASPEGLSRRMAEAEEWTNTLTTVIRMILDAIDTIPALIIDPSDARCTAHVGFVRAAEHILADYLAHVRLK